MQLEDLRQKLSDFEGRLLLSSSFCNRIFPDRYTSNEARVALALITYPFVENADLGYDFAIISRRIFQVNGIFITRNGDYILIPNAYEGFKINSSSLHQRTCVRRHELTGGEFSEKIYTPSGTEVERRLVFSEFLVGDEIRKRKTRVTHPRPEHSGFDFLDRVIEEMLMLNS